MSRADGGQRALEACFLALLFACSAALAFHYGHQGFMPLDQSIVFDGGWRVLSGQLPYRDFSTPNGVLPILIQAAFFRALGVTWSAYCVHAAIWNGLFTLVVYAFLRTLEASRRLAGFYALLSAVVFYPPFGVPYLDQHAFFFTLLSVLCAVAAVTRGGSAGLLLWGGVAPVLLLAGLSKQLPTAYAVPLLVWIWAAYEGRRGAAARAAAAGGVAALALLVTASWSVGVDPLAALTELAVSPGSAAQNRLFSRFLPAIASWNIGRFPSVWAYGACLVVPIGSAVVLVTGVRCATLRGVGRFGFPAMLALGLFAVSVLFAWFTENAPENALAYLFVSLGSLHVAVIRLLADEGVCLSPARRRSLGRLLPLALIALAAADAVRFNLRVNQTRVVHDMDLAGVRSHAGELPGGLAGLVWFTPAHNRSTPEEVTQLVQFLRQQGEPFFLLGDTSILYGITGQPSLNPTLWFHPNLTLPRPGTREFSDYEAQLIERLEAHRVRWLIVEGERTWLGVRAVDFPRLGELARQRASRHLRFGPYRVLELSPPFGVSVAEELRPSPGSGG